MYVLDSSAIISGVKIPPEEVVIPSSVEGEVKDKPVDFLLYRIVNPERRYVKRVISIAKKTGDYGVLSSTDIDVLALALQENAIIITDDYAIQNVASHLRIEFETAEMRGIREKRRWIWRCESCGRYYSKKYPVCPICGGRLRRVKRK